MLSTNLQPRILTIYVLLLSIFLQCDRSTLESINEPVVENQSPIINEIVLSRDTISINDTCSIFCDAYDPDSDSLTYNWHKNWGYFTFISDEMVFWQSPIKYGKFTVSCEVSDNRGGSRQDTVEVNVLYWKPIVFSIPTVHTSLPFDFENNSSDDITFHFLNIQTLDDPPSGIYHFFEIFSLNNTGFLRDSLWNSPPISYGYSISASTPIGYDWKADRIHFGTCSQNLSGTIYLTNYSGLWVGISNQYLPIRISKNNEYYYGWVEMSMDTTKSLLCPLGKYIVHNYRINLNPNEPILAGE